MLKKKFDFKPVLKRKALAKWFKSLKNKDKVAIIILKKVNWVKVWVFY